MSSKSRRPSGPVLPFAKAFQRSVSPSGRFSTSHDSSRATSPTRVNLHGFSASSPSVRFSINGSRSPSRSIAASAQNNVVQKQRRTCMCSPTTHPGSFRCSLHKNSPSGCSHHQVSYLPNRLNARRSAMANSLVRIGTVEGDLVRRALAQLIRPSSHQQRRRGDFQPKPSRLSVMTKATENDNK